MMQFCNVVLHRLPSAEESIIWEQEWVICERWAGTSAASFFVEASQETISSPHSTYSWQTFPCKQTWYLNYTKCADIYSSMSRSAVVENDSKVKGRASIAFAG